MCLLKCPLIESKLLQQWFSERNCGAWGERGDILPFAVYVSVLFPVLFFAMSEEKSMLTKKIALGIARLLFILPEKAGVVCKHEAFRGWQYFLFVLLFPRILSHVWKYMLLYRLQEAAVHKWHQNNTERISNPFLSSSIDLIGLPWVCFIYAIMSLAALGFVVVFIPETKGCSLEQISMELAKT